MIIEPGGPGHDHRDCQSRWHGHRDRRAGPGIRDFTDSEFQSLSALSLRARRPGAGPSLRLSDSMIKFNLT